MKTRIVVPASLLALCTAISAAHATGYAIVVAGLGANHGGVVLGIQGTSTTPINLFNDPALGGPSAALYDFDGNGIPDVLVTLATANGIEIFPDFGAKAPVFLPSGTNVHDWTFSAITPPTITLTNPAQPTTSVSFTYNPAGTPLLPDPVFDLNGDGIADTVTTGFNNIYVTDGATNQTTTIPAFAVMPTSVQIRTWSTTQAPEPTSLSLLALAVPLLLKRRR